MKLWILRPQKGLSNDDNPWNPWWDKNHGLVVRAESEEDARKAAQEVSGEESSELGTYGNNLPPPGSSAPWLSQSYSTCIELTGEGEAEVIIIDRM